jgi:hypothetical protein
MTRRNLLLIGECLLFFSRSMSGKEMINRMQKDRQGTVPDETTG